MLRFYSIFLSKFNNNFWEYIDKVGTSSWTLIEKYNKIILSI